MPNSRFKLFLKKIAVVLLPKVVTGIPSRLRELEKNAETQIAATSSLKTHDLAILNRTIYDIQSELDAWRHIQNATRQHDKDAAIQADADLSDTLESHMARLQEELDRSRERTEFVRQETMFELRAALLDIPDPTIASQVKAEIVNHDKFDSMAETGFKLNLGCGHIVSDGYLNVDMRKLPGIDVIADIADLPFPENSVVELYCSHLLEHFPLQILKRAILPHWVNILKPGGLISITVPDAEAMMQDYMSDDATMSFDDLREVTYGLQDYQGDFHYNMFSPTMLENILKQYGFEQIKLVAQGRRNGKCYEMEITGRLAW